MSLSPGIRVFCLFLLVFGVFAPRALADFAMCQAGWEWANNTLQQNPCQIAGALEAACRGFSAYVLGPLNQGSNYVTPQKNNTIAQTCQCNTVMFSLYMACTGCQNITTQPWKFWSQFCPGVFVSQYPQPIPINTAVPHWAFLNYTVGDRFDPVAAKAAGGLPELLAPVPSTLSLSPSSSSTDSRLPPSTMTMTGPTSTSTGQARRLLNLGAIIGGVIGGLAALAMIGVGVWIFLRKRAIAREDPHYTRVSTGAPTSENGKQPSQLRLYDPYDPSTYPTHVEYEPSGPYTTAPQYGRYTGVPEL